MTEPENLPERVPERFRAANPYAVPMSVLIGGAYVSVTDQVQLQSVSCPGLDHHAAPVRAIDD